MKGMPHFRQYPMGDVVNANLEPGEYVVRRNEVNALGVGNMELLNHADGAHGNLNKLIVSADLENKLVQDNAPVKSDVNGYPIADSPVRQRVDATRNMQEGGSVKDDIRWLKDPTQERVYHGMAPGEKEFSRSTKLMPYDKLGQLRARSERLTGDYGGISEAYDAVKAGKAPEGYNLQISEEDMYPSFKGELITGAEADSLWKASGFQEGGVVRGYQDGGSVKDYLRSLQENYQKYQGDIMTEAGDLRFNPSGQFTREGFAEEYNFPLEEAQFDTLYGYGTPGAVDAAINIKLPNRKLAHTSHMSTDKYGEFEESERKIKDQMTKEHPRASIDLSNMLGGDYGEAIEAEKAGYLDMGPYEQHEYAMGKSRKVIEAHRKREEEKKKEREASPEYRKMMMEGLGMKSDEEYDKFLEMKRRLGGGYQQGGEVRDVPSGNWGPKGAYNEALAASRDSTISEQELKSMALMDHFRKMGAGERLESSDMYNGKPTYKSEEAYKRAFGMQTPLNAKERFTQARLGLNPEMFTAQQKGLLGKVLLQRLGNEVQ